MMNWDEVLKTIGLFNSDLIATIINPIRKGDVHKKGRVVGFKAGVTSANKGACRKPRVFVEYFACTIYSRSGKQTGMRGDWIDVDNCEFEIIKHKN